MIDAFKNEYRFLSNFVPAEVKFEGFTYRSVEAAYVASKTLDEAVRAEVRALETSGQAKKFGKTISLRPNWENVRVNIMAHLLQQKFSIPIYKELLLATDNEELIEGNTWHDNFWGNCVCDSCKGRKGYNLLGVLLMQVRNEIRFGLDFSK